MKRKEKWFSFSDVQHVMYIFISINNMKAIYVQIFINLHFEKKYQTKKQVF